MKPLHIVLGTDGLEQIKKQHDIVAVIDRYDELLEDLFLIRNPKYKFDKNYKEALVAFTEKHKAGKTLEQAGSWFYFPWNKLLVHYLPDDMHQEVRTARNRNLITQEEQDKIYNFPVGVAGLSVGSHAALTISLIGAGKNIKIADNDVISASNLNRVRYDFTKIGLNKTDVVAEQLYQMNPYANVEIFDTGLSIENLDTFMSGLGAVVDAIDNLELKIRIRLRAKELGIPVIMVTDNGDNVIVDVERYDLDKNIELFNGAIGHVTLEEFQNFKPQDMPKLATKIAGAKVVVPRMLQSILQVGRTIYSWPQLGDAATLAGVAIAYAVKRLATGEAIKTGKFEVNLDSIFDPNYHDKTSIDKRDRERKEVLDILGL